MLSEQDLRKLADGVIDGAWDATPEGGGPSISTWRRFIMEAFIRVALAAIQEAKAQQAGDLEELRGLSERAASGHWNESNRDGLGREILWGSANTIFAIACVNYVRRALSPAPAKMQCVMDRLVENQPSEQESGPAASAVEGQEELAKWMIVHSFATGHGDTFSDLLHELEWQIAELRAALAAARAAETESGK
jgi:hypothetical protein